MSETYTASQKTVASRPRSQRLRETASAPSASASSSSAVVGDQYWKRSTDEEGNEFVATDKPIQIVGRLNITDEDGNVVRSLAIDADGNLLTDANIITSGDVVARGLAPVDIPTIQEFVDEYLETHGGGGAGVGDVSLTIDRDYKMQVIVNDANGTPHSSQYVDLPLEEMVVDGSYDATNKNIVLELKNGTEVTFSVADLVAGLASTSYVDSAVSDKAVDNNTMSYKSYINSGDNLDDYTTNGLYVMIGISASNVDNYPTGAYNYGFLEVLQGFNASDVLQRYTPHNLGVVSSGNYRYRYERQKFQGSGWSSWVKIGTEDIFDARFLGINAKAKSASTADSATTATKLASAATLWGNSFDGSSNITGSLKSPGGMSILTCSDDYAILGYGCCTSEKDTYIDGYQLHLRIAKNRAEAVTIDASGNMGVATAFHSGNLTPTTRLDVYGVVRSRAYNAIGNNNAAFVFDKPGTNYTGIGANGEADTIYFGPCNNAGAWVSNYYQKWKFKGAMFIDGGANPYIDFLHTYNGTSYNYYAQAYNGKMYLGLGVAKSVTIDSNGNMVAPGELTAYSDRRLKSDIKDLEYRGELKPKTYIKDGQKCIGFVAQDVRELYPELVHGEESEDGYLSLNYGAITAVLAAENKMLKARIERLEAIINRLTLDV